MKVSPPRRAASFVLVVTILAIVAGFSVRRQSQEAAVLRTQVDRAKMEIAEVGRLQRENQRLRERQIPAAELERLRADHAALPRLRAELEALKNQNSAAAR